MKLLWVVWIFTLWRLVACLLNLWASKKLARQSCRSEGAGSVSILIPARNEGLRLGALLEDLLPLINEAPDRVEVLVYDDASQDDTADLVRRYAARQSSIRLLSGGALPEGWLGKNYACHCLALEAQMEYFLFLDADVRMDPEGVWSALHEAKQKGLSLLSVFPVQMCETRGERWTVPILQWVLYSLLPLPFVQWSSWLSFSAANGQCMLFDASTYARLQPHACVKNNAVEDLAIAHFYKRQKQRIACLPSDGRVRCRMYTHTDEALIGFSKNVFEWFGGSKVAAVLFWMWGWLVPLWMLFLVDPFYLLIYLLVVMGMRIFVSLTAKNRWFDFLVWMLPQQWMLARILWNGWKRRKQKRVVWKGRTV